MGNRLTCTVYTYNMNQILGTQNDALLMNIFKLNEKVLCHIHNYTRTTNICFKVTDTVKESQRFNKCH